MIRIIKWLFFWRKSPKEERKIVNYGPFRTQPIAEPPLKKSTDYSKAIQGFKIMWREAGEGIKVAVIISSIGFAIYLVAMGISQMVKIADEGSLKELEHRTKHNLPIEANSYDPFTIKCYHAGKQILTVEAYGMPKFHKDNPNQILCIGKQCGHCVSYKGHWNDELKPTPTHTNSHTLPPKKVK